MTSPRYRADIDGLRALAVLGVVAFHAFPLTMQGGFIGVDVFFVISGFLISSILFTDMTEGHFHFSAFYARRIRRIFPALLIVLLSCYGFGWFSLLANEYRQLGKHIAAGTGFVSNIMLWSESGYFDNAADTKPLQHLWSLGVEEQFYILWPFLLWCCGRRSGVLTLTILLTIISFGLNLYDVHHKAVVAFYSPFTRFWELQSGAMLAWVVVFRPQALTVLQKNRPLAATASVLGILLFFYGATHITRTSGFPGFWALVPVLSAVLIIASGTEAFINRIFLANRALVWVGLISYPLYLWHWPLLSFLRIIGSDTPAISLRLAAIGVSLLLAYVTYIMIERPVRRSGRFCTAILIVSMCIAGSGGLATYVQHGLPLRKVVQENVSISSGADGGDEHAMIPECGIAPALKPHFSACGYDWRGASTYALLGDSKAGAMYPGLVRTSSEKGRFVVLGGGPVPVISDHPIYQPFKTMTDAAFDVIVKTPSIKTVVFVTATRKLFGIAYDYDMEALPSNPNYPVALDGLVAAVKLLKNAGKKVVLVVDNPTLPHPEDCLNRKTSLPFINSLFTKENPKCVLPLEKHRTLTLQYRKLLEEVQRLFPDDVRIFDTTPYLCDMEAKVCTHRKNGRFLYSYSDHISDYAAGMIGKDLNRFLAGD